METITFRCRTCQMVLKVGADKAGRTAKCSKCGKPLTIPSKSETAPPPPAQPKPAVSEDDDDGRGGYQLLEGLSAEQVQQDLAKPPAAPALKGPGRKRTKKQAQIINPDEWRRVGLGARIIAAGLCIWLAGNLLYMVPIVMGLVAGSEYAAAADERLAGSGSDKLNMLHYAVGVITGNAGFSTGLLLFRLSQIVHVVQWLVLLVGYFICLAAPNHFGTRLQILVLFGLAFVNMGILVGFKLLPMFGAHSYILLPFVFPEVAMSEMNSDRSESILTFWMKQPVLEVYGAILMTALLYLEPAMIATFLTAVGKSVRSADLEAKGSTAMTIGYSQLFIQTAWIMAAVCGSSSVLLWLIKVIYTLGTAFFFYQLYITILALISVAPVVEEQLGEEGATPKTDEEQDEKEDEDEEEEEEDDDEEDDE